MFAWPGSEPELMFILDRVRIMSQFPARPPEWSLFKPDNQVPVVLAERKYR